MAIDYRKTAGELVRELGGNENIINVTHLSLIHIYAMLRGGHWCPECQRNTWHYADMARKSPFYAQVWTPVHGNEDDYSIPMRFSAFDIWNELKEKLGLV